MRAAKKARLQDCKENFCKHLSIMACVGQLLVYLVQRLYW